MVNVVRAAGQAAHIVTISTTDTINYNGIKKDHLDLCDRGRLGRWLYTTTLGERFIFNVERFV